MVKRLGPKLRVFSWSLSRRPLRRARRRPRRDRPAEARPRSREARRSRRSGDRAPRPCLDRRARRARRGGPGRAWPARPPRAASPGRPRAAGPGDERLHLAEDERAPAGGNQVDLALARAEVALDQLVAEPFEKLGRDRLAAAARYCVARSEDTAETVGAGRLPNVRAFGRVGDSFGARLSFAEWPRSPSLVPVLARAVTFALVGVDAMRVTVEADIHAGPARVHDRRPSGRGCPGVARAGPRGPRQLRLRLPPAADHRESRARPTSARPGPASTSASRRRCWSRRGSCPPKRSTGTR